ncbi:MAG: neutral zinc metallopeptidase [Solirubrobacterales bacterium]|nr:neutral zinc metallopeptidase [Solirubrobacterales bacterium]
MRPVLALLLLALAAALAGCGGEDLDREVESARKRAEDVRRDVERRVDRARRDCEERRDRFGTCMREVLGDLEKAFERPERTLPQVRSRGRNEPTTIDAFLTDVLQEVDRYWTRTFAVARLPEPRVAYDWVAPGARVLTGCGQVADDGAAFYCPADDTIYVAQQFASDLYRGVLRRLPGEQAGHGRAAGDFAVAYVLAHEYAHNLQNELGVFDNSVSPTARPYELQADCLAGTWAYSVYAEGHLRDGDIEEAANAALAVGDFDVGNAQHHGTPQERRDALLAGFRSGEPSACERYLPR